MNELWRGPAPSPSTEEVDAESGRIEALETELARLGEGVSGAAKDKLYGEVFEARSKRIDRVIEENWQALEKLAGRQLR